MTNHAGKVRYLAVLVAIMLLAPIVPFVSAEDFATPSVDTPEPVVEERDNEPEDTSDVELTEIPDEPDFPDDGLNDLDDQGTPEAFVDREHELDLADETGTLTLSSLGDGNIYGPESVILLCDTAFGFTSVNTVAQFEQAGILDYDSETGTVTLLVEDHSWGPCPAVEPFQVEGYVCIDSFGESRALLPIRAQVFGYLVWNDEIEDFELANGAWWCSPDDFEFPADGTVCVLGADGSIIKMYPYQAQEFSLVVLPPNDSDPPIWLGGAWWCSDPPDPTPTPEPTAEPTAEPTLPPDSSLDTLIQVIIAAIVAILASILGGA